MEKKGTGRPARSKFLSPAKVNLFLKIIRKRPDGYHEIYSLMQPVSLYDEVEIEVSEGSAIEVVSDSREVPGGKENIAYRAAEVFFKKKDLKKAVSININKKIPVGAGLGGGSSDAATVLMALNSMLNAGLTDKELMDEAALLGSDVPFFILKCPALATGRGEILKKASLPRYYYILINPGFHVSTAWVYNNLDLTKRREDNILTYSEDFLGDIGNIRELLFNDLEAVTAGKYPEISALKDILSRSGALGSLMSGSGPTVFGVFADRDKALSALDFLKSRLGEKYFIAMAEGL